MPNHGLCANWISPSVVQSESIMAFIEQPSTSSISKSSENSFSSKEDCIKHQGNCDNFYFIPKSATSSLKPCLQSSIIGKRVKCRFCPQTFTRTQNCSRHQRYCQTKVKNSETASLFVCNYCGSSSNRKDNFKAHLRKCEAKYLKLVKQREPDNSAQPTSTLALEDFPLGSRKNKAKSRSRTPCLLPDCEFEFLHKTVLIEHLKRDHGEIDVKPPIIKTFDSESDFLKWKEEEEERTYSYFTRKNSNPKVKYFYCQHDGSNSNPRKTTRTNKKGQVKVGHFCIAKMNARVNADGKIEVLYHPTHSHRCDPQDNRHHPLPSTINADINHLLAMKIHPSQVLDNVKKKNVSRSVLENFVQDDDMQTAIQKRIRERARRMQVRRRLHKDESEALLLLARQLSEKDDYFVFYKPQNGPLEVGPQELSPDCNELFIFGIQTIKQVELMAHYCHNTFYIAEFQGTNHHGHELLSFMVIDNHQISLPVAHLITSSCDAFIIQLFFKVLRRKLLRDLEINCESPHDDAVIISEAELKLSDEFCLILWKWQLMEIVKANMKFRQAKTTVLRDEMTNDLKIIMCAKEENEYLDLCSDFLSKYEEKASECSEFFVLFRKYVLSENRINNRKFPPGLENTDDHRESFHAKLKLFLKRKVIKRVDDLVNILVDMGTVDNHPQTEDEQIESCIDNSKDICERHQRSLSLPDGNVREVEESSWEVDSVCPTKEPFVVKRQYLQCSFDLCFSKCLEASCDNLCSHLYSCSCLDTVPLCEHIHKVHSLLCRDILQSFCDDIDDADLDLEERNEEASSCPVNIKSDSPVAMTTEAMCDSLQHNLDYLRNFLSSSDSLDPIALAYAVSVTNELVLRLKQMQVEHEISEPISIEPYVSPYSKEEPEELTSQQVFASNSVIKRKQKTAAVNPCKRRAVTKDVIFDLANSTREQNADNLSSIVTGVSLSSFTPPLSFTANPSDVVLKCASSKLSILNLKSLDLMIPDCENKTCKAIDPSFETGCLYSCIIDTFLSKLNEKYPSYVAFSTELAVCASRGVSVLNVIKRKVESCKAVKALLFPANFTGSHWLIVVVIVGDEPLVMYYDPLQRDFSKKSTDLVLQIISDVQSVFPLLSLKEEITYVEMPKLCDLADSGVYICSFAQQTALNSPYYQIEDINNFRQEMYSVIVGKCLQRQHFQEKVCGVCLKMHSVEANGESETWLLCEACEQGYHKHCVNSSNSYGSFVCSNIKVKSIDILC